jgi:hypothetical protein
MKLHVYHETICFESKGNLGSLHTTLWSTPLSVLLFYLKAGKKVTVLIFLNGFAVEELSSR